MAVTDWALLIVTVHVVAVEQPVAPLHDVKLEPAAAAAVSVTLTFWLKLAVQAVPPLPHAMPDGLLVTAPVPVPLRLTVSAYVWIANDAVAVWFEVTVTVHGVVVHAPFQPTNVEPEFGVAVRVTCVPYVNVAEHVPGQEMPPTLLVTVPVPVPPLVATVSV